MAAEEGYRDIVSRLLDRGADVNKVVWGTTALATAAREGHRDIVSLLLDRGADVSEVGCGTTALAMAAREGHQDVVTLLLDRGADVNITANGTTPLIAAAKEGHKNIEIVRRLLDRGADVNLVVNNTILDIDGVTSVDMVAYDTTALIAATKEGHENIEMVRLLLDRGANVNTVAHGITALMAAAKAGDLDIVSLLLDQGADVSEVGWWGTTALVMAEREGQQDVVSLLLGRSTDVNMQARTCNMELIDDANQDLESDGSAAVNTAADGTIPLIAATEEGYQGTVLLLQDRDADVNIAADDTTPLIAAAKEGHKSIEKVRLLLDRGADVNITADGTTPLIAAAKEGHKNIEMVRLLLDWGADVNMVARGTTALITASKKGHLDIVSLLLDQGAKMNMVVHGTTALTEATKEGHNETERVQLLLDRGPDVNMVVNNTTALNEAACRGHLDIVSLLLDRGADVNMVVHGTTALIEASKEGNKRTEMVRLLLGRGANVNVVALGTTALIEATGGGKRSIELVRLLLGQGADANVIANNTTALIVAVKQGYRGRAVPQLQGRGTGVNVLGPSMQQLGATKQLQWHQDVVSLLLDRGADVNMVAHNTTALIVAVKEGNRGIASLLLDRGADPNMAVDGTTALIVATWGGHLDIMSLLLDRGADVNMVVHDTTALITATNSDSAIGIYVVQLLLDGGADANIEVNNTAALIIATKRRHRGMVSLLLDQGADVNRVVHDTTALIAATEDGHKNIEMVRLLLDRGANLSHDTAALILAARAGHCDTMSLFLDRGADVNMVVHDTTALITATGGGYRDMVLLLLDRGADVNMVVNDTTALIAATEKGHKNIEMVRLLLDRGADLSIVAGQYGTALITAICACQSTATDYIDNWRQPTPLPMLILERNPDVSIVAGDYGTALIAAICKLQFSELDEKDCIQWEIAQSSGAWQWAFLNKLLLSVYLAQDHINVAVGVHGTPLTAAISKGNLQLLRLLVKRGGDISSLGDSCGIALRAALGAGWDSQRLYDILRYLVDEGADINVVSSQKFGSALGQAAYMGNTGLVSFLLGCGADPLHVGGTYYRAALEGAYPTALDAALSLGSNAQSDPDLGLITELSRVMQCSGKFSQLQRSPPFPMPFTKTGAVRSLMVKAVIKMDGKPDTCYDDQGIRNLPVSAALTAQQADISCTALKEELIIQGLVQLVIGIGTDTLEFKRYEVWIRNDVRYFVTRGYDFGEAYAAATVGWRHFNKPDFVHLVEQHRGQWLRIAQKLDKERVNSIYRDNTGQEVIKLPYEVMPRRLWDLKSNRVVEFRMLHSELLAYKSTTEQQVRKHSSEVPVYWAISHSWESSMDPVETPINQYQWQVPLPRGLDLEHDIRRELLNYGIVYVWLDVLCLRQNTATNLNPSNSLITRPTALSETKREEWKLDVPTIGNIYRVAQGIIRYFNGLGRPFSSTGWDDNRHWLRRAWTLQEIKAENSTINGGIPRDSTGSTPNIMSTLGKMAGQDMTLRHAIRPVLKLAADVDSPSGCSLYALVREMSQRNATQSTDKVAGLVYLLRLTQLPTYDEKVGDNDAWTRCFHMLPLARKIELLFDFPYRSEKQQWFPTWSELMTWPEVNPDCDYSPAEQTSRGLEIQDLGDLAEPKGVATEGSMFMSNIWALPHCRVTPGSVDYDVRVKTKVYGFYGPYTSQKPIETMSPAGQPREFTIATADFGHSNNWVVCEVVGKMKARSKSVPKEEACESGKTHQESTELEIEVHLLRKVGVLRTDFCGEILAGSGDGSALRRIHALFV